MRIKLIVLAILIFFFESISFAQVTNFYVSKTGSDIAPGDGTLAHPWLTIQYAIDNSSGSDIVINVGAGEYTEQLTITKSLDLVGTAGEATSIIKAPALRMGTVTQDANIHDYLIAVYATVGTIDVRIQGFTLDIDSQLRSVGTARMDGVFFRDVKDAGGSMAGLFSSTIHNFASVHEYESWGIAVFGDALLTVNDNNIGDYTRDGILVKGDGTPAPDPDVTISNNAVTGSAIPLNGINIQDVSTGVVTGNTISGNTRSAPWAAGGLVVWTSTSISITGNHIDNNFYGIDLLNGCNNITISNNELTHNIKRAITIDRSDNNIVSGNTITGPVSGSDDTAIGLANNSTGNMIGGAVLSDGNIITCATAGVGNLYSIYMQADVGAGSNIIRFNTVNGGKRAIQFDGPPGITGTTAILDNLISGQAFGGITAYNNGNLDILNNTLTNCVRPLEFFGPVNVNVVNNTIQGSTFSGINLGAYSGNAVIDNNTISGVPAGNHGIWAQSSGVGLLIQQNTIHDIGERGIQVNAAAINANIIGNQIYDVHGYAAVVIDNGATGAKINYNNIHDNNAGGVAANAQTTEFNNNRILNNDFGIEVGAVGASFILHNNSIAGNDPTNTACGNPKYGVCSGGLSVYSGSAIATYNWWGSSTGPFHPVTNATGKGNSVSDNVVYSPWFEFTSPSQQYAVGVSILPELSWTGGGIGASYEMEFSVNSNFSSPLVQTAGVSYSFEYPSYLANSTRYYYRVRWTNAFGTSPWIPNELLTVNPAKPILYVQTPGPSSVFISWSPVPYSSGLTYDLLWSTNSDMSGSTTVSIGTNTFYTLPLAQGGTYYVQVVSKNSDGSKIISYSVRSAPIHVGSLPVPIPSYPTNVADDGLVYANPPTLFWYIEGNEPTLTYEIEVKPFASPFNELDLITSEVGKTFKKLLSSLTAGPSYKWRVRSVSGAFHSGWSSTATFELYTNAATVTIIPTPSWPVNNATVYSNPPTLYWYLGEDKIGLYYNVKITRVSTGLSTTLPDWSNDLFKQLPTTLIPGESYTWNVRSSLSSDGTLPSDWSSNGSFVIASTASALAVTPIPSWPVGGAIVDETMSGINLNWTANTTQPLDFKVRIATSPNVNGSGELNHGSFQELLGWVPTATTANASSVFGTLTAGATYYWQVKSRLTSNTEIESPWSLVASFSTAAGSSSVVPLVISPNYLQPIKTTFAVLTWNIPVQSESHLKYDLQYSKNPNFSSAITKKDLNEPSAPITGLESNSTYYWRVLSKSDNGSISNYSSIGTFKTSGTTAAESIQEIPSFFELSQNYPNPFNPSTRISFALPQNEFVSIKVYDLLGREVKSLLNNEMVAGNHSVEWSGMNNAGSNAASGTYIYRITAGNYVSVKKMILIK